jgi:hypothetical protein
VSRDAIELKAKEDPRPLRAVPLVAGFFEGVVKHAGWSSDESRLFVVLEFGVRDRAMLSFGLNGGGDFWERLIPDDETIPEAFLVDVAEP